MGSIPTLVRVFLCPCVGPFPLVGLTLTSDYTLISYVSHTKRWLREIWVLGGEQRGQFLSCLSSHRARRTKRRSRVFSNPRKHCCGYKNGFSSLSETFFCCAQLCFFLLSHFGKHRYFAKDIWGKLRVKFKSGHTVIKGRLTYQHTERNK